MNKFTAANCRRTLGFCFLVSCLHSTHANVTDPLLASPVGETAQANSNQARGILLAVDQATLSSDLPGRIVEMPFREGESFKKGDLLVRFDCAIYQAQLAASQAAARAAEAELSQNQQLAQLKSVGKHAVALSAAHLAQAQAEAQVYQIQVNRCRLTAPFDGQIVKRRAQVYESVSQGAPVLDVDAKTLEETALVSRPELREQDYQVRIHAAETRKALLRMLPGIEISAGGHYDSNSFLVNNSWADVGVKATWNLFNLLSGPAARKTAQANEQVAEVQRQAISLAIMAQLYVARANYSEALRQYKTSVELRDLDGQIAQQLRNRYQANSIGELQLIQGELNALNANLRQDLAYAELRNTYGQIISTVGLDLLPKTLPSDKLADISQALRQSESAWQQGKLTTLQSF